MAAEGKKETAILRSRIAAVGGEGGFSPTIIKKKKENTDGILFLFCLKRDKRCLNKGDCEQKVSEITTSIPALSAVAIWEMYPLFRYNDTNCYKAFFHCDKFRLDLL